MVTKQKGIFTNGNTNVREADSSTPGTAKLSKKISIFGNYQEIEIP